MARYTITILGGNKSKNQTACECSLRYFKGGEVWGPSAVTSEQNGAAHRTANFSDDLSRDYIESTVTNSLTDGQYCSVEST